MFDKNKFNTLKDRSSYLKNKKIFLCQEIDALNDKAIKQEQRYTDALRLRVIIQNAAQRTQKTIEGILSNIGTKSIQSVFDKEYIYKVDFVIRRNKTECDLYLELDGNRMSMLGSNGGGLTDIVSFANRIAFWKMDNMTRISKGIEPIRPFLLADEPFKFLHSPVLQRRCSDMLVNLSEEFGIQMVIISDQDDISGHKKFKMVNGKVKEIDN